MRNSDRENVFRQVSFITIIITFVFIPFSHCGNKRSHIPLIRKSSSRFQKSISASERFALTLRFFATGNSQETLSYSFRIGRAPVSKIVSKTCEAICSALTEKYLSYRKCEDDWLHILQQFQEMWNIPYTIGCLIANVFEWNVPN